MTTKMKNMLANKTDTFVHADKQKDSPEPVKRFVFKSNVKSFSPSARNILVLDLTDDYLKYSLYTRRKHSTSWLEAGEIREVLLHEREHSESIETGLKIIGGEIDLKKTKILIVVDGTGFFLRRLKIPELKGEALNEAIKWTCAKQIPYPIEDACLSVLNTEKVDSLLQVSVAVIKKEALNQYSFLGEKLLGVVPSPLALGGNYLKQSHDQNTIDILVHWGDSETVIDFIHAGCFEFSNNFKLEKNRNESLSGFSDGIADKIETNIRNSLDFYYSVYPGQQINQIRLPGDCSPETIERIKSIAQINTHSLNPFGPLIEDKDELSRFWDTNKSNYTLCAGAVQLETKYIYLPSAIIGLLKLLKFKATVRVVSVILTALLIVLGGLYFAERTNHLRKIESINGHINRMENSTAYLEAVKLENSVNEARTTLSQFKPSGAKAASLLKAISLSISSGVYFNHMNLSESGVNPGNIELRIEGYYFGELDKADVELARLIENLNKYCGFVENKFERFGERFEGTDKYINFTLTGSVGTNQ
jgi:hypothetical protein